MIVEWRSLFGATHVIVSTGAALFAVLFAVSAATAAGLTVAPVNIQMAPGQMATVLTIRNGEDADINFQVRPFAWSQQANTERLDQTDALLVSPPLGMIAPGASQVVRLVLRRPAADKEATYRILLDQIPSPSEQPGTVRFALRFSIPIFVQAAVRTAPHIRWSLENDGKQTSLVAVNDGSAHETARDIVLALPGGSSSKVEANTSPYILSGATRRWRVLAPNVGFSPGVTVRLTARAETGMIDQMIPVTRVRP